MNNLVLLILFCFALSVSAAGTLDIAKIEQLTGLKGQLNEKENVFKVSFPRDDLKVTSHGVHLSPAMGLTAWAAFIPTGNHVSAMGDIVLTEDQVNDVMSAALDSGLEVTALHNHFFYDSPKVMFMHIGGMGPQDQIATAVGNVFKTLKATMGGKGKFPQADIDPQKSNLTAQKLDDALATHGDYKAGVYKATFGKKTKMSGHEMGSAMGVNTWAAITGTDAKAVIDGDFAMYESELQPTLKALRKAGIYIVAIHNHMAEEEPRVIFLHYWGIGPAVELAQAVRSALDIQTK